MQGWGYIWDNLIKVNRVVLLKVCLRLGAFLHSTLTHMAEGCDRWGLESGRVVFSYALNGRTTRRNSCVLRTVPNFHEAFAFLGSVSMPRLLHILLVLARTSPILGTLLRKTHFYHECREAQSMMQSRLTEVENLFALLELDSSFDGVKFCTSCTFSPLYCQGNRDVLFSCQALLCVLSFMLTLITFRSRVYASIIWRYMQSVHWGCTATKDKRRAPGTLSVG